MYFPVYVYRSDDHFEWRFLSGNAIWKWNNGRRVAKWWGLSENVEKENIEKENVEKFTGEGNVEEENDEKENVERIIYG